MRPNIGLAGSNEPLAGPPLNVPYRVVERIECLQAEFQLLGFCDEKALVQAQIKIGVGRATNVATPQVPNVFGAAGLTFAGKGRSTGYTRAPRASHGRHSLIENVHRAVAVRQIGQRIRPDAVGIVGIATHAPSSEVVESQSVSAVQGDDSADLPVAKNGIQRRVHVVAKLLAAAEWQLISDVAGQDVGLVVVARSPI